MAIRLRSAGGVVAIYEVPSLTSADNGPLVAPLSHLSNGRLKFHSELDYPKVLQESAVTLSLPARVVRSNGNAEWLASYNLFTHGRPGIPWVLSSFRLAGQDVPAGQVPVQKNNVSGGSWARWVSIGANATHVTAFEYAIIPEPSPFGFSAISIPITVWVTDELL